MCVSVYNIMILKRETEEAMKETDADKDERYSSLQGMRSDLVTLRKKNTALQVRDE